MTNLKLSIVALCLLGTACIEACANAPEAYSAGPTYATVVDDATGQRIEGAVVVAQWVLEGGPLGRQVGVLVVREAVTDASGQFRIDGWGPVPRPSSGVLDRRDPDILVFKPGYKLWYDSNYLSDSPSRRVPLELRNSRWNGATVRLKKVDPTSALFERNDTASTARGLIWKVMESRDCAWKQIPKAIAAFERELVRIGKKSKDTAGSDLMSRMDCGDLEAFKRAYGEAP